MKDLTADQVDKLNVAVKKNYSLAARSGSKYGKLTVLGEAGKIGKQRAWLCRCECGREHIGQAYQIKHGLIRTCGGCKGQKGAIKRAPAEYHAWRGMIQRCTQPRSKAWKDYGRRGITVCPEWLNSFEQFYADMGARPNPRMSIERIDNDLGYFKGNCKWATQKEQMNNTRRSPRYWSDWAI
jgi:hypothetical protein